MVHPCVPGIRSASGAVRKPPVTLRRPAAGAHSRIPSPFPSPGMTAMPRQQDPCEPSPRPQDLIDEVVVRFDAYARARAAGESLFPTARTTPRQEQRAFDDLQAAVTRLRNSLR